MRRVESPPQSSSPASASGILAIASQPTADRRALGLDDARRRRRRRPASTATSGASRTSSRRRTAPSSRPTATPSPRTGSGSWSLTGGRRAARWRRCSGPASSRRTRSRGATATPTPSSTRRSSAPAPEDQEIFKAYIDGINRYIQRRRRARPREQATLRVQGARIHARALDRAATPPPSARSWCAASARSAARSWTNQALLDDLVAAHGESEGWAIFNDLTWINDADSPVTIPPPGAPQIHPAPRRQRPCRRRSSWPGAGARRAPLSSTRRGGSGRRWACR